MNVDFKPLGQPYQMGRQSLDVHVGLATMKFSAGGLCRIRDLREKRDVGGEGVGTARAHAIPPALQTSAWGDDRRDGPPADIGLRGDRAAGNPISRFFHWKTFSRRFSASLRTARTDGNSTVESRLTDSGPCAVPWTRPAPSARINLTSRIRKLRNQHARFVLPDIQA